MIIPGAGGRRRDGGSIHRRGGAHPGRQAERVLAGVHPADLGAHVLRALVDRTGIDPAAIDDVIMGCVDQIGPQACDIARTAWLSAGLPESVPGVTIDRQCGSSQQAVHFAAPGGDVRHAGPGRRRRRGEHEPGPDGLAPSPLADAAGMPDPFAAARLAAALRRPGDLPVPRRRADRRAVGPQPRGAGGVRPGEPPARARAPSTRAGSSREIAPAGRLQPGRGPAPGHVAGEDGRARRRCRAGWAVTAAVACQISDGAGALLVASERGGAPARPDPAGPGAHLAVVGSDPVLC